MRPVRLLAIACVSVALIAADVKHRDADIPAGIWRDGYMRHEATFEKVGPRSSLVKAFSSGCGPADLVRVTAYSKNCSDSTVSVYDIPIVDYGSMVGFVWWGQMYAESIDGENYLGWIDVMLSERQQPMKTAYVRIYNGGLVPCDVTVRLVWKARVTR